MPEPPTSTDPLFAKMKAMEARAIERLKQQRAQASPPFPPEAISTPPPPAKMVKLPIWSDAVRAVPNGVLRSALFGVVGKGRRKALEGAVLATWAGTTIRYTGWRLDQADLDVWLITLHFCRESGLGAQVHTSISAMLKAMGRAMDGRAYDDFNNSVRRLTGCVVEITTNRKTYGGSLIESFERYEETGDYVLYLNPKMIVLFEDDAFTLIDREQRQSLRMALAKWLHCYVLSHQATAKNPHRISIDRLRELCGSEWGRLRDFRNDVRRAVDQLQAVGVMSAWRITDGNVLEFVRPQRKRRILEP
jgi:hypothetical protein